MFLQQCALNLVFVFHIVLHIKNTNYNLQAYFILFSSQKNKSILPELHSLI